MTNPLANVTSGQLEIPVADWKNPNQFKMVIQATTTSNITNSLDTVSIFSPELTLTVKCPEILTFETVIYPSPVSSYVGANLEGNGVGASYSFDATLADLPKCTEIIGYEIIDQSPAGKITYPSPSFC